MTSLQTQIADDPLTASCSPVDKIGGMNLADLRMTEESLSKSIESLREDMLKLQRLTHDAHPDAQLMVSVKLLEQDLTGIRALIRRHEVIGR